MLIDRNKSEKENLLDHINESLLPADSKISLSDISFSFPSVIPNTGNTVDKRNPNRQYIHDTIVTVNPSHDFDYDTPADIRYRRINIGIQYQLSIGKRVVNIDKRFSETSLLEIKNLFCDEYSFINDSIEIRLSDTEEETKKLMRLSPIDGSLLYTGTINVYLVFKPEDKRLRLRNIINSDPLDGFYYETL